jgi:hypothetical protein
MKRLTNNVITGSDKRLGLYFYYSHHFGHNIVRKTTSLTGHRVKTDKAFEGLRQSSNRMRQASPIAASLYKLIPTESKQYSIYRLLTSEALKMIKQGLQVAFIIETLNRTYIEPLINEPENELNRNENFGLEKQSNEKGLKSFIRYPQHGPYEQERRRKIRSLRLLQHTGQKPESEAVLEFSNEKVNNVSARINILRLAHEKCKQSSKTQKDNIHGLVYLCRLPECKNLKLWIRATDFPAITG